MSKQTKRGLYEPAAQRAIAALHTKGFDPTHLHDDTLLTVRELAQWWRVSVSHLNQARLRGDGVKFLKIGGTVRYRVSDCRAFMAQRERTSTGNIDGSGADA